MISKIKSIIKDLIGIYQFTYYFIKESIKQKILTRIVKVEPKKYEIAITKLPEKERERVLTEMLLRERQEKVLLQEKLKKLEEQLDKTRQVALAKIFEELIKEEKEKGKPSISLYEVLQLARRKGILPFRKPPVVYDLTLSKIGYLKDIILHPSGGFSFVIEISKGNEITTPPFSSLWEAVFHAENISQQLPNMLILNVVKTEDGRLVKVPEAYVNALYQGEPAEKIIAYLKQQIDKLANEAMTNKLLAEIASVENNVLKITNDVSQALSKISLNLYENLQKTVQNILVPTTLSAIQSNTLTKLELEHQRVLAEHAKEMADKYASRLKKLEESMAPEKIITILMELSDRLDNLNRKITELASSLAEVKKEKEEKPT